MRLLLVELKISIIFHRRCVVTLVLSCGTFTNSVERWKKGARVRARAPVDHRQRKYAIDVNEDSRDARDFPQGEKRKAREIASSASVARAYEPRCAVNSAPSVCRAGSAGLKADPVRNERPRWCRPPPTTSKILSPPPGDLACNSFIRARRIRPAWTDNNRKSCLVPEFVAFLSILNAVERRTDPRSARVLGLTRRWTANEWFRSVWFKVKLSLAECENQFSPSFSPFGLRRDLR